MDAHKGVAVLGGKVIREEQGNLVEAQRALVRAEEGRLPVTEAREKLQGTAEKARRRLSRLWRSKRPRRSRRRSSRSTPAPRQLADAWDSAREALR